MKQRSFFTFLCLPLIMLSISLFSSINAYEGPDLNNVIPLYDLINAGKHASQTSADAVTMKHHGQWHHHHHRRHSTFESISESLAIDITMTIPQMIGTIPSGANLDVTPFAISPNGRIFRGTPTNIVPASGLIQALNTIDIKRALQGNYVIGYFVTLGNGSPTFSPSVISNFSGVVLNNPVGSQQQTITIPVQTLFLASLASPIDVLAITANFPVACQLVP